MEHFWNTASPESAQRDRGLAVAEVPFISIPSLLPSIGITKRRLKHLEAIQLVREQRELGQQELAYNARPFVLCGIPFRRPSQNELTYSRRNGKFSLDITGHPSFGLPFGQDRLVLIWVATLVILQNSRTVHFESPSQVLEYFELPKNGYHYRRIVRGFERIFGATIFFGTDEQRHEAVLSNYVRFHFFDRMQLWFNLHQSTGPISNGDSANVITLSEAFYNEVQQHKIPIERKIVAALANAPGALDLYIWLSWRCWTLKPPQSARIPLFGKAGLRDQLGSVAYARDRRFREKLLGWLREVKAFWPQCPASLSRDGDFLFVTSAQASPAIKRVEKPVNS